MCFLSKNALLLSLLAHLLSLLSHLLSLLKQLRMWSLNPLVIEVIEEIENL